MKGASKIVVQLTAFTGVGASGWYLGKLSECEKNQCRKRENDNREYENLVNFINLKRVPGLPLFGTVSAATPIVPSESQQVDNNNMGSTLSAVGKSRVSQIMKYGFPGFDNIRSFEDFVLSYDRRNRTAHWVFEHLTKDRVCPKENIDRSKSEFKSDESVHPFFRATNSDYKGSGYDRGHLAAAGNHRAHQTHMDQTFYLSNIAPQVGKGFNRDSWNRLEKHVRKLTNIYNDVYVCTGPLYLPKKEADGKKYVRYEVIGANHVAVPTHFYKIVVGEMADGTLEMEAFVMPNAPIDDNTPLTNFQVPPESVERAAGLLFFDKLSRSKLSRINGKKS